MRNNEEPTTGFRRVSAKDRKARLERVEMVFPETQPAEEPLPVEKSVSPPRRESERYPPVAPRVPRRSKRRSKRTSRRGFTRHDGIALLFFLGTVACLAYFVTIWRDPYTAINPLAPSTPTPIYVTATPFYLPPTLRFEVVEEGVLYGVHPTGTGCEQRSIAGSIAGGSGLQIKISGVDLETVVPGGSASVYGVNGFEIPVSGTEYTVQLFDMDNLPRSEPVTVLISENCDLNLAVVNFVPAEE